jgi:hypothetical protein
MRSLRTYQQITATTLLLLFCIPALAFEPIRDPGKLWSPVTEQVQRVTSAKVLLADYALIKKDFPEVSHFSNSAIDEWLIRNTAFISKQQVAQTDVNDPIPTSNESRMAYRPREYRRAHVFTVDSGGLIDAKGTGAIDPSGGSHDNGLATLGDMIREYMYEKLIHAIFSRAQQFDTVGSYAVIDYGFDIKHPDGARSRAGTVLRQAHARYHDGPIGYRTRGQSTMLPRELQLKIESLLRHHGLTSTVKYGNTDFINLQGAQNGAVIDFGSFLVEEKFTQPLAYFYDVRGNVSDTDKIMDPSDRQFLQPDAQSHVPFKIWGYSQTGKADSKYDNPYIWSHEVAESIRQGRATRHDVEQHVRNMFDRPEVQTFLNSIQPISNPRSSCGVLFK